jgi:hypothetical protein
MPGRFNVAATKPIAVKAPEPAPPVSKPCPYCGDSFPASDLAAHKRTCAEKPVTVTPKPAPTRELITIDGEKLARAILAYDPEKPLPGGLHYLKTQLQRNHTLDTSAPAIYLAVIKKMLQEGFKL